jgi:hypothetical protein
MNFFARHKTFFLVLLGCLVLYFSLVGFWTGFVTKARIQANIKSRTGINIEMGIFYFYPFTGNGYVKNVRIPNPNGFLSKNAFSIDKIQFHGSHKTLYGEDSMQIESMHVQGVEVHFESKGMENNFHQLYLQASKYYDGSDAELKWFKRMHIAKLEIEPMLIIFGHKIINKTVTFDAVSIENVGTPEEGVGFYRFGNVLLENYRPVIQRAMEDPQTPLNSEMRNTVLKWLELKKVR